MMCANPDRATTKQFRARKTVQRGYKVLNQVDARSSLQRHRSFVYRCGHNVDRHAARTATAYVKTGRGLHCYLSHAVAQKQCIRGETVVAVTYKATSVIAAEKPGEYPYREVVVSALHISQRAWKQAGLPATKGGDS